MTSIRVKAMLVALDETGRLHAVARHDPSRENPDGFHRLVGGGVEPGETHRAAIEREVAEELGARVHDLRLLTVLENIYVLDGEPGHELVVTYAGRLDPLPPEAGATLTESNGAVLPVDWRPVDDEDEALPLYPDGVGDVVRQAAAAHLHEELEVSGRRFTLARAREEDVPALVALLADDPLGAGRETAGLAAYLTAFRAVDADPAHLLVAVRDERDAVVGTLQLTLLPGLSRGGATRLQVEAARMADSTRGLGLGRAVLTWAHEHGRARGAVLAQLTTDKSRTDAQRFYDSLGYTASHEGYKRPLEPRPESERREVGTGPGPIHHRRNDLVTDLSYTTPGIDAAQGKELVEILQHRLAAYNDLHLTLKHVHWNVVGPNFISVHEMIDPQVELVRGYADETAERIATLGGSPLGTPAAIEKIRDWDDYHLGRDTVGAHLGALDKVYVGVVTSNREAIATTEDLDPVTQDMLIAHTAELEKFQWFVRAHLERADGSLVDGDVTTEKDAADAAR